MILEISAQDKIIKVTLSDLEKLRVTDFKEGNIINSVQIVRPEKTNNGLGRSLLKYVYELDETNLTKNTKLSSFLDKKIKEYEEGSLLILEIEPSYGAYLVAIGKKIIEEEISA